MVKWRKLRESSFADVNHRGIAKKFDSRDLSFPAKRAKIVKKVQCQRNRRPILRILTDELSSQ
jgi:hypothetical protein